MTAWEVIRWWELRRMLYNAVLLALGIASIYAMDIFAQHVAPAAQPNAPELETGLTVVMYGFMANVCYTLGWIVELVGRRKDKGTARTRARKNFLLGFWFSCLLTSAPVGLGLAFWLTHRSH